MPGFWLALGMPSRSEPTAIVGPPLPCVHVADHAVGMPEMPRVTLKPFFSRISVMLRDVSTSCMPSSPKLKIESIISWTSLARFSTPFAASALSASSRSGGVCAVAGAASINAMTPVVAVQNSRIFFPREQSPAPSWRHPSNPQAAS